MRANAPSRVPYWGCGCIVAAVAMLALCISLPIVWNDYYQLEYCWFPPSGPNVEVVVSACDNPSLRSLSPDGKHMIYVTDQSESWLRNFSTGEVRPALITAAPIWLDNQFVLGTSAVWDVRDDSLTQLQWVESMEGTTSRLEDGTLVFSSEVVEWFQRAEHVYYVPEFPIRAIALSSDFKNHPESNYLLKTPSTSRAGDDQAILTFLEENDIPYIEIGKMLSGSAWASHDGRLIARFDGFFTAEGEKIGPMYDFTNYMEGSPVAYGWAHDDSGVYVQYDRGWDMWTIPKAQPILKINLPPEYMSPAARAAAEAYQLQLAQQKQARQRQGVMTWGSLAGAVVVLLGGGWLVWRRRKKKSPRMHL